MTTALTEEQFALYEDCLVKATTEIMQSTCGVALQSHDCDGEELCANVEVIIGVISLVGDAEMSVFIGLPSATATALVLKFAGFEVPFDSPDMGDAIGEVANIVGGGVKAQLDTHSVSANISLPTVIRAENLQVLSKQGAHSVKKCFKSELGMMWVGMTAGEHAGFVA